MEITLCTDRHDVEKCAILMHHSEPWTTLGFDLKRCTDSLQGDYRECYIIKNSGTIAGFVVLQFYGLLRGYIQTICVIPELRGQGIGTILLQFSESRIRKVSPNVFMCVSSFNIDAQRLYARLGYEQVGILKDHLVRGQDEYLLRKSSGPFNEFVASA